MTFSSKVKDFYHKKKDFIWFFVLIVVVFYLFSGSPRYMATESIGYGGMMKSAMPEMVTADFAEEKQRPGQATQEPARPCQPNGEYQKPAYRHHEALRCQGASLLGCILSPQQHHTGQGTARI